MRAFSADAGVSFGRWRQQARLFAALEMLEGLADDPSFRPAHPAVGAGVRGVEGIEPELFITDRVTAAVSDAFNATRLSGDWGVAYGTLPVGVDTATILDRARVGV